MPLPIELSPLCLVLHHPHQLLSLSTILMGRIKPTARGR